MIGRVTIEQTDEGQYVIVDDITGAFGNGPTLAEAIRDYVIAVLVFTDLRERDEP